MNFMNAHAVHQYESTRNGMEWNGTSMGQDILKHLLIDHGPILSSKQVSKAYMG